MWKLAFLSYQKLLRCDEVTQHLNCFTITPFIFEVLIVREPGQFMRFVVDNADSVVTTVVARVVVGAVVAKVNLVDVVAGCVGFVVVSTRIIQFVQLVGVEQHLHTKLLMFILPVGQQ
jgi:hypothetical protein